MSAQARQQEQADLKARLRGLPADDPVHDEVFARLVALHHLERAEAKAAVAELSPWDLAQRIELAKVLVEHHFGLGCRGAREVIAALAGATPAQIGAAHRSASHQQEDQP